MTMGQRSDMVLLWPVSGSLCKRDVSGRGPERGWVGVQVPAQYGTSSAHTAPTKGREVEQGHSIGDQPGASEELLANGHGQTTVLKALREARNHHGGS